MYITIRYFAFKFVKTQGHHKCKNIEIEILTAINCMLKITLENKLFPNFLTYCIILFSHFLLDFVDSVSLVIMGVAFVIFAYKY